MPPRAPQFVLTLQYLLPRPFVCSVCTVWYGVVHRCTGPTRVRGGSALLPGKDRARRGESNRTALALRLAFRVPPS